MSRRIMNEAVLPGEMDESGRAFVHHGGHVKIGREDVGLDDTGTGIQIVPSSGSNDRDGHETCIGDSTHDMSSDVASRAGDDDGSAR